jgi:acyl carrier protein phosphodiesterase
MIYSVRLYHKIQGFFITYNGFKRYYKRNQGISKMNFLAHLYLSGNNEEIIVGNFIGDYVKGSDYMNYPENIKKGLLLHRHIDSFTDCHPVTRKSKQHVESQYRKYAGIVIDIFYDFLLASEWERYSNISLEDFVENTFSILKKYYDVFPQGIKNWFPNFIRNNWLMSYSYERGVEMVLHRMASRTSLPEFTDFAMEVLDKKRDSERKILKAAPLSSRVAVVCLRRIEEPLRYAAVEKIQRMPIFDARKRRAFDFVHYTLWN